MGRASLKQMVEVSGMGQVDTIPVADPDQVSANQLGLLRGIFKQLRVGDLALPRGTATGGDGVSIFDVTKNFDPDVFSGGIVRVNIDGVDYFKTILSTIGDTLLITPLPVAASATALVGTGNEGEGEGQVLITVVEASSAGNDYTVEVVQATEPDTPTGAVLEGTVLTITLGTNALGEPIQNGAGDVASVVDDLEEFTAVLTIGGTITETVAPVEFANGYDPVVVSAGDDYEIQQMNASIVTTEEPIP